MSHDAAMVYVVDDDDSIRESLRDLFASVGLGMEGFGAPRDFLGFSRADVPSCLVLDVRLPGYSGFDFQRDLKAQGIFLPTVFITGHGDIPMSVRAMKAGAIEFLTKPYRDQELLDAVLQGIASDRERREHHKVSQALGRRFATLTTRERQVMTMMARGLINKQIAADIGTTESTVKAHRAQIMQKMQAASLADLLRMADRLTDRSLAA